MQDERNFGTAGSGTGGTGSGLGSSASGFSGSTGGSTSGMGTGSTSSMGATGSTGSTSGGGTATLDELKQRADGLMDTAAEKLEEVAEKVDSVAGLIPKKGVGGQANAYGHTAADTLESVARWLRDNDTATLQRELGGLVANRPLSMVLLAVGAGFVAGKVLR
ncbi:hypothetical protein [Longimicrobium sp.]|uniref:hypothetical protein n=1 Tax=Longimicrobium sp. TaxID=2029185 RepID=UPI002E36EC1E|nr:hypothetical protein [Longimicrobium sp.]HEX6042646.1 hypothetical protein [Longimicrobium sp.]